ncbi:MAG: Transcriptional regulatory protein DegU [Pseudomonadota bacterium]
MNAPSPQPQSLLIIDDHPVYREALGEALAKAFAPLGIEVQTASHASEGMTLVDESRQTWVVLLDVLMPGLSGLAGIKVFKSMANVAHVVSISGLDADVWEPRTVAAGATLFLSKNNTSAAIFKKIHGLYTASQGQETPSALAVNSEYRLTQRQLEVLTLISMGHPNKIIADLLDIKEQTVKIHINQIFKELRVFNRTQAVLKAQKLLLTTGTPQA